jgi:hypothetical protein
MSVIPRQSAKERLHPNVGCMPSSLNARIKLSQAPNWTATLLLPIHEVAVIFELTVVRRRASAKPNRTADRQTGQSGRDVWFIRLML